MLHRHRSFRSRSYAHQFVAVILAVSMLTAALAAFAFSVNLTQLATTEGTAGEGVASGDFLGWAAAMGDVNGDGLDDVIVGAPSGGADAGSVVVVFGQRGGLAAPLDLSTLDGTAGFRVIGAVPGSQLGASVASGDVTADGVDDLLIGAPGENAVYIVAGRASFEAELTVSMLDGTTGFRLHGPATAVVGMSVAVGDVNADGAADVLAANNSMGEAAAYVRFGRAGGSPVDAPLGGLDSASGIEISEGSYAHGGFVVGWAGDVNADGVGDLLLGSPDANRAYVVFGQQAFVGGTVTATDATAAATLVGTSSSSFGAAVSATGDVNADGIDDVVVGAPTTALTNAVALAGRAYVVFGSASFPPTLDVVTLNGVNGGFQVSGAVRNDRAGWSVARAGDVNDDGVDDVLLGAPYSRYGGAVSGASYVVFGSAAPFQNISLAGGLTGTNGFQMIGAPLSQSGFSLAGGGDVTGDGAADVVVGARLASPGGRTNAGVVYVLYGEPSEVPDSTAPVIAATRTPAPNADGWNRTSVVVTFACTDAESGIQQCSPAVTLSTERAHQSVVGTAVDVAGNRATVTVADINIDLTAPVVRIAGARDGRAYVRLPSPRCSAIDRLSRLAVPPALTVTPGATAWGFTSYTASCAGAEDKAGNVATPVSVTYRVRVR